MSKSKQPVKANKTTRAKKPVQADTPEMAALRARVDALTKELRQFTGADPSAPIEVSPRVHRGVCAGSVRLETKPTKVVNAATVFEAVNNACASHGMVKPFNFGPERADEVADLLLMACRDYVSQNMTVKLGHYLACEYRARASRGADQSEGYMAVHGEGADFLAVPNPVTMTKSRVFVEKKREQARTKPFDKDMTGKLVYDKQGRVTLTVCPACGTMFPIENTLKKSA